MNWQIPEIRVLSDTEIIYFDRYLSDILKYLEPKSEIIPLGNPAPFHQLERQKSGQTQESGMDLIRVIPGLNTFQIVTSITLK